MSRSNWIHKLAATALVAFTVSAFAGMSSADVERETKYFFHGRVGYYPTHSTCLGVRNSHNHDWACQQLGYARADSVSYYDCVSTNPNWSLVLTGTCSRPRNSSPQ